MDCAIENTPLFSNTSDKMKDASFDDSAMISISISLWCWNFLGCHSKKIISKDTNVRENNRSFCWINRYKWNRDYTHQSIYLFWFPAEIAKHCPHYVFPAGYFRVSNCISASWNGTFIPLTILPWALCHIIKCEKGATFTLDSSLQKKYWDRNYKEINNKWGFMIVQL